MVYNPTEVQSKYFGANRTGKSLASLDADLIKMKVPWSRREEILNGTWLTIRCRYPRFDAAWIHWNGSAT